ncbi:hypothetical protein BV372_24085 [Nostoc sp. T09]|nr:hypothetical protein BV372_24085 [Nostoc sp. T09]
MVFNLRHQDGQQFMTFALIFIANHIDKIHTITNETALGVWGVWERVGSVGEGGEKWDKGEITNDHCLLPFDPIQFR